MIPWIEILNYAHLLTTSNSKLQTTVVKLDGVWFVARKQSARRQRAAACKNRGLTVITCTLKSTQSSRIEWVEARRFFVEVRVSHNFASTVLEKSDPRTTDLHLFLPIFFVFETPFSALQGSAINLQIIRETIVCIVGLVSINIKHIWCSNNSEPN